MSAKKVIIGTAVALVLLVGAGVAYANGSSGGDSSGDGPEQSTGPGMERAKSVALEQVNGRVTATEFQDEEGYYEVEVTRDDGSQVDVEFDANLQVVGVEGDDETSDDS